MRGPVPTGYHRTPLDKCLVVRKGADVTVVANSHATIEALRAADFASTHAGIEMEVIDVRTLNPLDFDTIAESVKKTKRLLVVDDDAQHCGFAGEIIARVCEQGLPLAASPTRVTHPDCPSPSSAALAAAFYPTARDLFVSVTKLVGRGADMAKKFPDRPCPVDVPHLAFPGPF
jgi:pyruvate dehydrogenase E1 component beta subunit